MDLALLLVRLLLGLGMAAHGAQKLLGWFGGHGLAVTAGFFENLGFRPGRFFATAAALGETGSGLLVALGLFGPIGPALMILVMVVAMLSVHAPNGFFVTNNGIEVPLLYALGAFVLVFTGPGTYSLDTLLGWQVLSTPQEAWISVAVAVAGGLINVMARRQKPTPASSD